MVSELWPNGGRRAAAHMLVPLVCPCGNRDPRDFYGDREFGTAFCGICHAQVYPPPEPKSTTVDPELAEALERLAVLVRRTGNVRRARTHVMRRILWPPNEEVATRRKVLDAHLRLTEVAAVVQVRLESALERVESLIAGGRAGR